MRCMVLAQALQDDGWRCVFATTPVSITTLPGFAETNDVTTLENIDNPQDLRGHWPAGADLLIVDHYQLDRDYERRCRPWARHVLAIDDLARPHDCDALLDQTYGRRADDYRGVVPQSCETFLGAGYALLRPEFAALRQTSLARRTDAPTQGRILVSLGSTDPDGVTPSDGDGVPLPMATASPPIPTVSPLPIATVSHRAILRAANSETGQRHSAS